MKFSFVAMVGILGAGVAAGTMFLKDGEATAEAELAEAEVTNLPASEQIRPVKARAERSQVIAERSPAARSATPKPAARNLSKQHRAALDFDFEGVSLTDSRRDVQRKHPRLRYERKLSDERRGQRVYYHASPKEAKAARYFFYNDRVYRVEIYLDYNEVRRSGGLNTVSQELIRKFGTGFKKEQQSKNRVTMSWQFPEVERDIEFSMFDTKPQPTVRFAATDSKVMREVQDMTRRAGD